jgi:hypothetical protein
MEEGGEVIGEGRFKEKWCIHAWKRPREIHKPVLLKLKKFDRSNSEVIIFYTLSGYFFLLLISHYLLLECLGNLCLHGQF